MRLKVVLLLGLLIECGAALANNPVVGVYNCQDTDNNAHLSYQTELTVSRIGPGMYRMLEREHIHPSDPMHTYDHIALQQDTVLATAWQNQKDLSEVGVEIFNIKDNGATLIGNWLNLNNGKALSSEVCSKQQ